MSSVASMNDAVSYIMGYTASVVGGCLRTDSGASQAWLPAPAANGAGHDLLLLMVLVIDCGPCISSDLLAPMRKCPFSLARSAVQEQRRAWPSQ